MKVELWNLTDPEILDQLVGINSGPCDPVHIYKQHAKKICTFNSTNNFEMNELIINKDITYAVLVKITNLDEKKMILLSTSEVIIDEIENKSPSIIYEN